MHGLAYKLLAKSTLLHHPDLLMASKALLVLGVLLATVLLVASEATLQHQEKKADGAGVVDQKYGGYPGGGGPGSGGPGGGYPGGGYPGGGYPGGGYPPRNGYGPGRGRCYYGCCRRGYYGGCGCCSTANDMPDAEYLPEPHY